jgi:hypothetical protein
MERPGKLPRMIHGRPGARSDFLAAALWPLPPCQPYFEAVVPV